MFVVVLRVAYLNTNTAAKTLYPRLTFQVCYSFLFIILAFNHPPIQFTASAMSSSLGHAANATYPSPLCYVPFDINQPYSVPNVLAIKALSEIRKGNMLERLQSAARHRSIEDESDASLAYNLYFSSFFMVSADIPPYFHYNNYDMSRQEFMGRQWSNLNVVKEFKRPEVSSFQDIR